MTANPFVHALGAALDALPAPLRDHFRLSAPGGRYHGRMERIWRRRGLVGLLVRPALALLARLDLLFPETGRDVPFELVNQVDHQGTMRWLRRFHLPGRVRQFDAVMLWDPVRGCIVDLLGRDGRLAVDLHVRVEDGALHLTSGRQWLRLGRWRIPLPAWLAGRARVREWAAGDGGLAIEVRVDNPLLGEVFGYTGRFRAAADPPSRVGH